ncbi:MAG TPA: glutaminase [Microbacteriaceae bacterium]|nr:glutaminase [Microbacteriaceae bacterium]
MIQELLELVQAKPRELIARMEQPRAIGPIRRAPRLVAVAECWRLGAILLDTEGQLYAAGTVIRAERERQHGYPSRLAEQRAELKAAAQRGGIDQGRTVNLDVRRLDTDHPSPPLRDRDGILEVEWAPNAWVPLEPYLRERIALMPNA